MKLDGNRVTHVICPYCCHRFAPNEAKFRLLEGQVIIDKDEPKKKGRKKSSELGMVQDEVLYKYYVNLLGYDDKDAAQKSMQYEVVSSKSRDVETDESDLDKYGFYQRIVLNGRDGKKHTTDKRLCPSCHNSLPVGYGLRQTILISIIGDARAGKSVYLTMLINELENNKDFPSKLSFIGDQNTRDIIFKNYQKPLLQDRILIDSTKRKRIPPFSYNFWYKYRGRTGELLENNIDIIFYDIAGEDMRNDYTIRQNGYNIKDSSGLIFLLDPTNFKSMKDIFMIKDRNIIDAIPQENSIQNVFSAMFNYFIGMDKDKSPIPLALAMSKVDLFRFVELPFFDSRPESRMQNESEDEAFRGFIDMNLNRSINLEVKELLKYLNEDSVIHNALGCFKNISCFAISSLGRKPITEKISDPETNETVERGYVDGEPEPFRIKDPFYWILLKNDLLYYYDSDKYYKNGQAPERGTKNMGLSPLDMLFDAIERLVERITKKN